MPQLTLVKIAQLGLHDTVRVYPYRASSIKRQGERQIGTSGIHCDA